MINKKFIVYGAALAATALLGWYIYSTYIAADKTDAPDNANGITQ